ncbi:response regulator [Lacinutrix sp. Hel_I_90]|uniref:response regulator n=1 Tax=Lacinutrix sp. Hel_I_90 TaxID=1249999 RepID=UPI0005CAA8ED|nr:response regulator [Lacinutrix sp. Hel_I_90]
MTEILAPTEKLTILIIEDNHGDFVLIEDYLLEKFTDITIVHCTDYAHSANYLKHTTETLSLILLDLNLPDMQGVPLINEVLACNHEVPVIVLTGYSDLSMAKKSLQIGVSDYLVKDEINPMILYKTIIFAINRSNYINQIEHEKRNYENLFNFNPQPTWLLDAKSLNIINANLAAQNKYGLSLSDFQKLSFVELHPKEEQQHIKNKLISKEEPFNNKHFTHLLSDGKEIKVEICFQEITGTKDHKLIVQSNDISESLQHISTIENQNATFRDIAWTQSHVVRAPLSRILGIVNLLEEQPDNFDKIAFWLKQLKTSTNEMDAIVKKIVRETNQFEQD